MSNEVRARGPQWVRLAALCACALGAPWGCGAADDATGSAAGPIISNTDDRKEVYETERPWMRSYAQQATAAVISADRFTEGGIVAYSQNLCADQRFAEQYSFARCSATLIDDDLVLTAGHCVPDLAACESTRLVFNLHYVGPGVLSPVSAADIFSCAGIVVNSNGNHAFGEADFAVLRLDRLATPRFQPAPVRTDRALLPRGIHVKVIGFPNGVPAKVDNEGNVRNPSNTGPYFHTSLDTMPGNSGSGVYEGDHYTLAGINVASALPVESYTSRTLPDGGTCLGASVCISPSQCPTSRELYVGAVLDALCADPTRSPRLCGTAPPPNDQCAAATPIAVYEGREQTLWGSTSRATHEFTPRCGRAAAASPDVFYRFTLGHRAIVYADVFGSDYPAVVYLLSNCGPEATNLACNGDACGTGQGQLARVLPAGTYYLGVSGHEGLGGRYTLHVQFLPASQTTVLTRSGTRVLSGTTAGQPDAVSGACGGASGADATWYYVTCPDYWGGTLRASTCNRATWNTVLHLRQGNSPLAGCNDNTCGAQSTLRAAVSEGSGIRAVYVDGAAGASGPFTLVLAAP